MGAGELRRQVVGQDVSEFVTTQATEDCDAAVSATSRRFCPAVPANPRAVLVSVPRPDVAFFPFHSHDAAARTRPAAALHSAARRTLTRLRLTTPFPALQAVLLNELSATLGPELCLQFVTPEVICLAEDPVFRVRKAAALNLQAVCRTVGPVQTLKRLLPAFLRLCADDIWGVRKACAESLGAVSQSLDPTVRASELVPVCDRLVNDNSKWVRNAAQQQLGPFISSLPAAKVTPGLLAHYIRMGLSPEGALASPLHSGMGSLGSGATPGGGAGAPPGGSFFASAISIGSPPAGVPAGANSGFASAGFAGGGAAPGGSAISSVSTRLGTEPSDSDLAAYCAFSFPAVALKLGRARWPELRGLFGALARDAQRKVRKPLAAALHELARILGPDLAEAELLPAFDFFLRDVEEVRVGVVRHVAVLLAALAPSTRESYLPILDEALTGAGRLNWRFRHLLAAQLPLLSQIFSPAATYSVVAPFALRLLSDEVAIVREEAAAGIAPLLNRLAAPDHAALQENLVGRLLKLSGAACYRDRLQFLRLCGYLGNATTGVAPATFRASFLGPMLGLSRDPVRNVRRMLADLLAPLSSAVDVLTELRAQQAPASADSGSADGGDAGGAAGAINTGAAAGAGDDVAGAAAAAGDAGPVNPRAAVAGAEQGAGAAASAGSSAAAAAAAAAPVGRAASRHVTAASGFVPGASGSGPPSPSHGAGGGASAAGAAFHHSHSRRPFGFTYDATAIVRGGAVPPSPAPPVLAAAGAAGAALPAPSPGGAGSSAVAANAAAGGSGAPPLSTPGGAGSSAAGPLSVGSTSAGGGAASGGAPPLGSVSSTSGGGGGAATPGPFSVSAALHTHRLRADTSDLPEGLDEDMLPQWAWAAAAAAPADGDVGASDGSAATGAATGAAGGIVASAASDAAAAADGAGAGSSGAAADGGAAPAVPASAGAADAGGASAAASAASTPTKPAAPAGDASADAPRRAARGSGASPAPSAAAESMGSAAAASLTISAEVLAALDILAQDEDAETAGRLSPTFLQGHRSKPLLPPRKPAGGDGAAAEGAGGSVGEGLLAGAVDGSGIGLGATGAPLHAGGAGGIAAEGDEGDYGVLLTLEDHEVHHTSPGAAAATAAPAAERAAGLTAGADTAARDPASAASDGHPFSFEQQLAALPAADAPQT